MAVRKSERLLNLLIMLLVQRQFIGKPRIRELLYPGTTDDAFERMFDRDKEELRSLGVPIEVGHVDAYFDDEPGYRIRPDEFALPEIALTADESAVLGVAARVWQTAGLAEAASGALRKLTASGVELDTAALDIAQPTVVADEPSFDAFWEAVQSRTPLRFGYRRSGSGEAGANRRLQPWGLTRYAGRWYVVGHDLDRDAERVFRLSRVTGAPSPCGPPASYDVPAGTDIRDVARRLAPRAPSEVATLRVRQGAAVPLRRRATQVEPAGDGWDRIAVPGVRAEEVLALGPAVVVEAPASLRDEVVGRLRAALA